MKSIKDTYIQKVLNEAGIVKKTIGLMSKPVINTMQKAQQGMQKSQQGMQQGSQSSTQSTELSNLINKDVLAQLMSELISNLR